MTLGRIVDEGAKVRGRAFAGGAAVMFTVAGFGLIGRVTVLPGGSAVLPEASAGRPEPMLRASWTWTGGGADDKWSTVQNWSGAGGACVYPCSTADDVTFNIDFDAVFDATRTIDDLVIVGVLDGDPEPNFDAGGSEYTLTCDTATISGSGNASVTVHVNGKAAIETN